MTKAEMTETYQELAERAESHEGPAFAFAEACNVAIDNSINDVVVSAGLAKRCEACGSIKPLQSSCDCWDYETTH